MQMSQGTNLMEASHQWATRPADERFRTLEDLTSHVHGRRMKSRATDVQFGATQFEYQDGQLIVNNVISPSTPTHWAFGQLSGQLGAPAQYLRKLADDPDLLVRNLNFGIDRAKDQGAKFMTIASDDGLNTLQACTSQTYGRIWDADVVDAVSRVVERSDGRFHNPPAYGPDGLPVPSGLYASDRDVFCFMIDGGSLLEVGPRAKLNRGFIVSNSEVGSATFRLTTFLFNVVCGNHIVWGAREIRELSLIHRSGAPARFDTEAMPLLMEYANESPQLETATIRRAIERPLPKEESDLLALGARFRLTRGEIREAREVAKREEGQCASVWDLVQGLTAYARDFEYLDARTDLERRAGKLLELVAE